MSTSTNKSGGRNFKKQKRMTKSEMRIANIARKEINKANTLEAEKKFQDFIVAPTSATTTGTILPITSVTVRGTGYNERIGQQVKVTNFNIRYGVVAAQGAIATDAYNFVRVIIFRWFDDVVPVVTDMLQAAGNPFAALNITSIQSKKLQILHSNLVAVNQNSNINSINNEYFRGPYVCNWNPGDLPEGGHLYAFIVSDSAVINHPTFTMYGRARFTDM